MADELEVQEGTLKGYLEEQLGVTTRGSESGFEIVDRGKHNATAVIDQVQEFYTQRGYQVILRGGEQDDCISFEHPEEGLLSVVANEYDEGFLVGITR